MKMFAILVAVLFFQSVAFAGNAFQCTTSVQNAWPASFVLDLSKKTVQGSNDQKIVGIHALSANEAAALDSYERPNADQSTYSVVGWNGNDAAAFLLLPRNHGNGVFQVQETFDEQGGAPFDPSSDVTVYTCRSL